MRRGRVVAVGAVVGLVLALTACQAPPPGPIAVARVNGKAVFSLRSDMTADSRYVVFVSSAANIVPGFAPGKPTAYRWDRNADAYAAISVGRLGEASLGEPSLNTGPEDIHISNDGRYVVFTHYAVNLVAGDTEGYRDVFVRDMTTGVTSRVSQTAAGVGADRPSDGAQISANGRWIVFDSGARNLPGSTGDLTSHVYRYDVVNRTLVRADVTSSGAPSDAGASRALVDDSGRVYFRSAASNMVASPARYSTTTDGIYVRDLTAGTTTAPVRDRDGKIRTADLVDVTPDGRYLLLDASPMPFLGVAGIDNPTTGLVLDRSTGTITGVATLASGGYTHMDTGAISADGRWVVFGGPAGYTTDTLLQPSATQLYYRDRVQGVTRLANLKADGTPGWGIAQPSTPKISDDGRTVLFETTSNGYTPDSIDPLYTKVIIGPTRRP
jgi:Tol biopolymer transport system component